VDATAGHFAGTQRGAGRCPAAFGLPVFFFSQGLLSAPGVTPRTPEDASSLHCLTWVDDDGAVSQAILAAMYIRAVAVPVLRTMLTGPEVTGKLVCSTPCPRGPRLDRVSGGAVEVAVEGRAGDGTNGRARRQRGPKSPNMGEEDEAVSDIGPGFTRSLWIVHLRSTTGEAEAGHALPIRSVRVVRAEKLRGKQVLGISRLTTGACPLWRSCSSLKRVGEFDVLPASVGRSAVGWSRGRAVGDLIAHRSCRASR